MQSRSQFVSVFSIGTVQEVLLEHCTTSDAASLSRTCRDLRPVFQKKLHNLGELYLNVDAPGYWVTARDMMDQLESLAAYLTEVRKIVLDDVSAVTLPMLGLTIRRHFRQIEELQMRLQYKDVIWQPIVHWLPGTIQTLHIDSTGHCCDAKAISFGDWSRNLRSLQITCDVPIILENHISLEKLTIYHLQACQDVIHVRELDVKYLGCWGCFERITGVVRLCIYHKVVEFADIVKLCPELIELKYPYAGRYGDLDDRSFDLTHSTLQKLSIHSANQLPWKVPAGCEIERSDCLLDTPWYSSGEQSCGSSIDSDSESDSESDSDNDI